MTNDQKQVAIIMQNSMLHATNIVKHNSDGKLIKLEDVLVAAEIIVKKVIAISKELG